MSTASSSADTLAAPSTAAASVQRVVSIDIFRGLTMLVMIFVNDLADVHGLPWWTYHAHAQQDLMTYVDMVFPFFLFIVGMSMPLAIERRLKQNPSHAALWLHIAMRSCGLIVLGLILANAEKVDPARTHMSARSLGASRAHRRHPLLACSKPRYAPSADISRAPRRRSCTADRRLRNLPSNHQ